MRQVRKGSVSIPLSVVEAYIEAMANPSSPDAAEAAANMHRAIIHAHKRVNEGLDDSNLTVCIGKIGHVSPVDARRFLSGDIPRITIYRDKKTNHHMPLYFKQKPSHYTRPRDSKKPAAKRKAH